MKKLLTYLHTLLCILTMLTACADNAVVENTTQPVNGDVTINFDMTVPGLTKATRTAVETVDKEVTSLRLFLFDHKGGFTKVVEATTVTKPTYDSEKTEYSSTGFGTYTATIPGNTSIIHFVANYDNYLEEGFDEEVSRGRSENAVMAPLTTTSHLYWGRYTYEEIKNGKTAVLYRNYAKVSAMVDLASDESTNKVTDIQILGWTLCYEPVKASVTPFNADIPDNPDGTPGNLLDGTPYAFNLDKPFVTLPAPKSERLLSMTTAEDVVAVLKGKETEWNPKHCLFEHTEEGYEHELFALFKLRVTQDMTGSGTKTTTRYYKIKLLEDTKKDGDIVIERTPYDIIRNHEYIITFKGIEPEGGYGYTAEDGRTEEEAIRLAMIGLPANNSTVDIKMTIPEVQSADYVLRVEGSTVRYYKDITSTKTINDIEVYFASLTGSETTQANDLSISWENTTWDSSENPTLTITPTDTPNYYTISFSAKPFEEGNNGSKHYKYGVIRISEKKEYLLSRFVQVFIGDPITFRPLLISSDIPSRTDERLTVVLNVPDLNYLPQELYPIQLTFGSEKVDVEKNLDVEQMKVDFDGTNYENVLQYKESNGSYAWTTTGNTVPNNWGYKYIYTLESPEDAGIHRITLRTVTDSNEDFKVLLEGKSLVTGTQVFNTRELDFKMQKEVNGTDERRIMIDGAMEETHLTTAYLFKLNTAGKDTVTVSYTLGLYDEENRTAVAQTPSGNVKLWVYYDHDQLTPIPATSYTPKKDAENNWFVEVEHSASETTGSILFEANDVVKDAVVFITARGNNNYGTYNTNYYSDTSIEDPTLRNGYGAYDFLSTGVNADAQTYRSASAIINVLSTWSFNPATSTDGAQYMQESEVELPYGADIPFYVRIEKPANTDGVILKLNSPTLQIQANDEYYTIKDETNGIIELQPTTGDFCYLKFLTTQYANAGKLELKAINELTSYGDASYKSTVPYDEATVIVTNISNTFSGFAFATEDVLNAGGSILYGNEAANRTVRSVKGSHIGIRVFFPGSFKEQTESFTFKMKSACYELHNDDTYKYSGAKTDIGDGSHIITVKENGLTHDEENNLCYLDLVLIATTWSNAETIRFLTNSDEDDYIRFYPYNISIETDKLEYPITVKHSLDGETWVDVSEALISPTFISTEDTVYYQITLPDVGPYPEDKKFDVIINTNGLTIDNENNEHNGIVEAEKLIYSGLLPNQTYELALKSSIEPEAGGSISSTFDFGETVDAQSITSVLINPYMVTYSLGNESAEGIIAQENEIVTQGQTITIPKNFTLYKEGYTLTAWKDEEGTEYAIGTEVNVTKNMTLTPVFTENSVSLDDRETAVTIRWDFQRQNGAPTVAWEGKTGLVWVAQATVTNEETTETIDVKLDISTSPGKFANGNWTDWAQINEGTTLTIPSQNNATVKVEAFENISDMTIAGDIIDQATTTPTYTYEGTEKEINIVFGVAGKYYRYVEVTLPEHNVLPTTYEFTGVSKYSTTSELGTDGNNQDKDVTSTDKQTMYVKQRTNTITLEVTATGGNNDSIPTINSSNYILNSAIYSDSDGVWTLELGVTNLVDEDITINCDGYSNSQTASIYVKPYLEASIDKNEYSGDEKLTMTITVTTVGENKSVNFYLEDRGNGLYLDAESFSSIGENMTITQENYKWHVQISGLSTGTSTYTYTLDAINKSGSSKIIVAPSGTNTDCYNSSAYRFESSVSFNYTINEVVYETHELYSIDGDNWQIMKDGISITEETSIFSRLPKINDHEASGTYNLDDSTLYPHRIKDESNAITINVTKENTKLTLHMKSTSADANSTMIYLQKTDTDGTTTELLTPEGGGNNTAVSVIENVSLSAGSYKLIRGNINKEQVIYYIKVLQPQ